MKYFNIVRPNLAAPNAFAEIMKGMNYTGA